MIKLSYRMQAIANSIDVCESVADIGTDHGYLPIYLVEQGVCQKAIAMDINDGPLERAKQHIIEARLMEQVETRLSNGADRLAAGEVSSVIIAGMGGRLIMDILSAKQEVFQELSQLVIQPQSDWMAMRIYLQQQGYVMTKEVMVCEEEKYYVVMKAHYDHSLHEEQLNIPTQENKMDMNEKMNYRYGVYLLAQSSEVFRQYLLREQQQNGAVLEQLNLANVDAKVRARKLELVEGLRLNQLAQEMVKKEEGGL